MQQQFISESCSWFHTVDNFESVMQMQKLSGIGLNRLGVYSECISNPLYKYFLFEYQINMIHSTFYTGVCYSANCTSSDLMYISKSLNSYIPAPYNNLKISEIIAPHVEWTNYLIVAFCLFGFYMIGCCWAGAHDSYQKWKRIGRRKIIEIFSIIHSYGLVIQRTSSNQRLKLMVGLRCWAFICICIYNISSVLLKTPTYRSLSNLYSMLVIFYYSFDIWLFISGFYLSFQLSRNWNKVRSHKLVWNFLFRKLIKTFIINLLVNVIVNCFLIPIGSGPLWSIFKQQYYQQCQQNNFFDIFLISNLTQNKCDYWLWIWQAQLQLTVLGCLMFVITKSTSNIRYYILYMLQIFVIGCGYLGVIFVANNINYNSGVLQGSVSRWPTTRGVAYIIGFNLGYWYFWFRAQKRKQELFVIKLYQYRLVRFFIPFFGFSLLFLSFFYCFKWIEYENSISEICILQTLHIVIPLGVILFISGALFGFKGPVSYFFHDQLQSLISRLSVSAYAVQYIIFALLIESRTEDIYINLAKAISFCSCSILSSLVAGFFFCIFFEMPVHKILNLKFHGEANKYIELQ